MFKKPVVIILACLVVPFFILVSFTSIKSLKNKKVSSAKTNSSITASSITDKKMPSPTPLINLIEYKGDVKHIFFHALIAFPDIAYKPPANGFLDTDCVTADEFKKCLHELYSNNYVLVNINETFGIENTPKGVIAKIKKVKVPEGKKPIVISVDDMVYDSRKMGLGMVDKIILDENGEFAAYTKHKNGEIVISKDNEIVPILETFVKQHPDFSVNNAKATFAMTGFEGIFGYRTYKDSKNRDSEITAVKPIVSKLKQNGWTFASHGYGHVHSRNVSYETFLGDTKQWKDEVESLVGSTQIYIYPYGQYLDPNDKKHLLLEQYGFRLMCGVAEITKWEEYKPSTIFMSRQGIDGYSLRNYRQFLEPMFDTEKVLDKKNRHAKSK